MQQILISKQTAVSSNIIEKVIGFDAAREVTEANAT